MAFAELWCVFPGSRHLRQGLWGAGEQRRPGLRVYRRRPDQARRPGEEDPRVWILHGETVRTSCWELSVADAGAPTSALLCRGLDVPTTQSPLRSSRSAIQTTRWPGTTKDIEWRSQKPPVGTLLSLALHGLTLTLRLRPQSETQWLSVVARKLRHPSVLSHPEGLDSVQSRLKFVAEPGVTDVFLQELSDRSSSSSSSPGLPLLMPNTSSMFCPINATSCQVIN